MSYKRGAPKQISVGGITFHLKVGWKAWTEWEMEARKLYAKAASLDVEKATAAELAQDRLDIEEGNIEINRKAMKFIVGWDGVVDVDEEGNEVVVPFSQEELEDIDVAIITELLERLTHRGEQVGAEVVEGNAD